VRLAPYIAEYTAPEGALVISGIRTEECGELLGELDRHFLNPVWRGEEQEWVGLALTKKG
jgi:ribosomal protein L11 methylase PrmA